MLILNMRKEKYSLNVFKGAGALAVMLLKVEGLAPGGGDNTDESERRYSFRLEARHL
jgi:hypothetical protein